MSTSGTIPNEPAPTPPSPDPAGGAFIIPDIEPYGSQNSVPGVPQPASLNPPIQAPVQPTPIPIEPIVPEMPLPQSSPSIPYQQTVVVEDTPPQIQPPPTMPEAPFMPDTPPMPPVFPEAGVPVAGSIAPDTSTGGFVPQGLMPEMPVSPPVPPVSPPPIPTRTGGGIGKKILLLFLFLLLIGAVVFGVRFGFGVVNDNKEVTLQYWGLWENSSVVAPVIADFQAKNPKIKVQYVQQNFRQYRERLQAAIDRGEGPDVFRFHETWIPMLKNEIQPIPADVMSPSQFSSQYYKVASQDLLAGSTLWGIPLEIDGLGLYVNEDLFTTAGLTYPQTYEDLLSVVPKLTVKNGTDIVTSAIALGTTNNIDNFSDILSLMILQNGGKLTNPTGREAEEALVFYHKFAAPSDPMYTWNSLQDNYISAFANGRVAMIIAPSWRAFDIKQLNPNLHFHVEPVPQLPGNTVSWASYWVEGVSSKTKNQKQAMTFLKYLTSKESAVKLFTEASKLRLFGEPYALVELGGSISTDPFAGAYIKQAPNARSFPLASMTHDNGINDRMIKYMEDAINSQDQSIAPSSSLDTMSRGFQQVLSSYGLSTGGSSAQ